MSMGGEAELAFAYASSLPDEKSQPLCRVRGGIAQHFTWAGLAASASGQRVSRFLLFAIQRRIRSRASIPMMLRTIAEHDSQYFRNTAGAAQT